MQCKVHQNPHYFLQKNYDQVTMKEEKDNTLFGILELLVNFQPNPIP